MRKSIPPLVFAWLVAAGCSAALAQAEQRVEIIATPATVAAAQAVLSQRHFDNRYEMTNGQRLAVSSAGNLLQLRYGRRAPAMLRHDGQGRFVSHDGQLALQFVLDGHGEPQQVRFAMPAAWL